MGCTLSHFAKIVDGIVVEVIVAEQDFIDKLEDSDLWIQTSYNTRGNINDTDVPLRYNYAGVGYTYDEERDAFISPKPYDSWVLNESSCLWESPIPQPDETAHSWNEDTQEWEKTFIPDNE